MKKDKPKLTKEELSRIRSEAAKKGAAARKAVGYANVGRKKGTANPTAKGVPNRTMSVRDSDYHVFVKCAFAANVPLVEFMHMNAEGLKRRNPQLFGENTPKVEA